ncbi:MAG: ABC transporter ATP-binding protein, partial [Bacteroidetes bacterium]|nr:ABC transporter ATP-binding protein [Bacteroidota bacterium]
MSNTAIKVESLSKIYRLGEIGTGTISRDLERWFKTKVLKQEDPFLKIGETNDRANKGSSNIVYSLRDINFEIKQGEAVGIIGRNGAGKSTLLKILSRVTTPTTGKINIKGRVASLLEVGTGFHPELTGKENIYLNGAILGMRKREIDRKLDEIIDFSGVERYIDTPVKRYSSGMYVRLAFAVAAHLESEILIVDEVLAVGDSDFQKKCLGKMGEVSKGEGRTVLFVSHNMGSIKQLTNNALLLEQGCLNHSQLSTEIAVKLYQNAHFDDSKKRQGLHYFRRNNIE